ncbi:MAG: asparagine synthase-related protein [Fimbriimonadales bacterium]
MSGMVCSIRAFDEKGVRKMLGAMKNGHKGEDRVIVRDDMVVGVTSNTGSEFAEISDGKLTIALLGRFYNSATLRPHLKPRPKETSDASMLMSLFKMKDRKAVHYLEGGFAFVIAEGNEFYAARDPMGIKPLYYARVDDGWLFATELRAFPKTVKQVQEFPAGCYLDSKAGARRYFKLQEGPPARVTLQEAMEIVRPVVTEAVIQQLKIEGEPGVYITGSVESCIIAAIAANRNRKTKTYSVGLEESTDGNTAKKVASWLGTDHTHREITQQEILDCLPHVIEQVESFDGPIVRHAVADYFVVQEAARSVDVLMSGDGGEELFAGYAYLRPMFPEKLTVEIRQITENLHRTQLHRWDRITSMFGVEGRCPVADRKVVSAVSKLPTNMKINEDGRSKWVLRRAFNTMLPAWVVDRPDSDDAHFTGIQEALRSYADTVFTEDDVTSHNAQFPAAQIRGKDELLYFQIWSSKFRPEYIPLVGRTHL